MNLFKRYDSSVIRNVKICILFLLIITTLSGIFLPVTVSAEKIETPTEPIESFVANTTSSNKNSDTDKETTEETVTNKTATNKEENAAVDTSTQAMKTGDKNRATLFVGIFLVSFGVIGFAVLRKKEKGDKFK